MKRIHRHLPIFPLLGLFALAAMLIASGKFAQIVKPDEAFAATIATPGKAPAISAFNLGDCLRDTDRRNWPPAYALVCTDLANAMSDEIREPVSNPARKPIPQKGVTPTPQAPARDNSAIAALNVPVPLLRPTAHIPTKIAAAPPACLIDEHGGTIFLNKTKQTSPPQTVARNDRSRTAGVALLVPAACGVKSPMKAKVLFADDFKGYRGVVILGLPSNRRLVVAGLDALRVKRGDKIERGTVLGSTLPAGAPALVTAFNTQVKPESSLLFFDLRNSKGAGLDVYWLADAS
jgi:hypothetical protein